jgi:hypothetical protein
MKFVLLNSTERPAAEARNEPCTASLFFQMKPVGRSTLTM